MLSLFDDYPIHQTPDPLLTPATTERTSYERYWFNGYSKAGDLYLGIGAGRYPHLGIMDGAVSVVRDGVQRSYHVSGRAPQEPTDTSVGPMRVEITEPMRSCRVIVEDNETDFACDLRFDGRTANIEEPRHTLSHGGRRIMDTTRFTQLGRWSGWVHDAGGELRIEPDQVLGTKDRSWGFRPVGGHDGRGAPPLTRDGGIFFLWAPLHFDDLGMHFQLFEDQYGRPLYQVGAHLPVYGGPDELPGVEDEDAVHMRNLVHQVNFSSENRMITAAKLAMTSIPDGVLHEIDLEVLFTFRMRGIGYSHADWGHGLWKGELAMATEEWALADVDESAYENQHVQHVVRATMGDRVGIGVLEQNILGPHQPSGFTSFLDRPDA